MFYFINKFYSVKNFFLFKSKKVNCQLLNSKEFLGKNHHEPVVITLRTLSIALRPLRLKKTIHKYRIRKGYFYFQLLFENTFGLNNSKFESG
ncbi:MAG: hypothetical protein DWQ02_07140 [Bacteroidetes bacterium]|nr:MAG: hypothetical protein DWQ02_07140 [Bacteroidota bacterium]